MSNIITIECVCVNTSLQEGSILRHGGLPPGISDVSWICWSIYGFSGGKRTKMKSSVHNFFGSPYIMDELEPLYNHHIIQYIIIYRKLYLFLNWWSLKMFFSECKQTFNSMINNNINLMCNVDLMYWFWCRDHTLCL